MDTRRAAVSLLVDRDHYERVTLAIAKAQTSVWIATANVKQLMTEAPIGTRDRARGRYVPILDTVQSLCDRGVHVRLLHATPPSGPFRQELARFPLGARRLTRPALPPAALPRMSRWAEGNALSADAQMGLCRADRALTIPRSPARTKTE